MKILVVTSKYPTQSISGCLTGLSGLLDRIVDKGHTVTVLTGESPEGEYKVAVQPDLRLAERGSRHRWARDRQNRATVTETLHATKPHVIIASDLGNGLAGIVQTLVESDVPLFFDMGGQWLLEHLRADGEAPERSLFHHNGASLAQSISRGWFRSSYLRQEALRYGLAGTSAEAIPVVYPGLQTGTIKRRFNEVRRLLWAGELTEGQDPESAIFALNELHKQGLKRMTLDIWGEGDKDMTQHLRKVAERFSVSDAVSFCGNDRQALMAELVSYDAFVHSAHCGLGFAREVAEAMRAGVPVVASVDGCVDEWLQDGANGLAVAPGDAQGLAFQLKCLAELRDCGHALACAARRDAEERFSCAQELEKVIDILSRNQEPQQKVANF